MTGAQQPGTAAAQLANSAVPFRRPSPAKGDATEAERQAQHQKLLERLRKMSAESQGHEMYHSSIAARLASQDPRAMEIAEEQSAS